MRQANLHSRIGLSTWSYLSIEPFKALDKIYSMGFTSVELWGDYPHFWPEQFLKKNNFKKIKNALKKFTGSNSIHAPIVSLIDKNMGLRQEALRQIKQTVVFAEKLNIKYVTIHGGGRFPGMQGWDYEKESFDILASCLNELGEFAKKHNVFICIENVPGELGFSCDEMIKLFKKIRAGNIFITFDIGHENLLGNDKINKFFDALKNRIKIIHISDNLGSGDDHLPIGCGNIKFCDFFNKNMRFLSAKNIVGEFVFNKKNPDYSSKTYLNFARNFNLL